MEWGPGWCRGDQPAFSGLTAQRTRGVSLRPPLQQLRAQARGSLQSLFGAKAAERSELQSPPRALLRREPPRTLSCPASLVCRCMRPFYVFSRGLGALRGSRVMFAAACVFTMVAANRGVPHPHSACTHAPTRATTLAAHKLRSVRAGARATFTVMCC